MPLSTLALVKDWHEKAREAWARDLERAGVEFPAFGPDASPTHAALALTYLYWHLVNNENPIRKDDLAEFIKRWSRDASNDCAQAARHLKYSGFDVRCSGKSGDQWDGRRLPSGYYALAAMTGPSEYFLGNRVRRAMRVAPGDWEDLKRRFGNRCGVCNRKPTTLEKGHKDPLSGDEVANLIPLCAKCNNWAGKDVVLDDNGRVRALASEKLVMKSSLAVQKTIFDELSKKFKARRRTC